MGLCNTKKLKKTEKRLKRKEAKVNLLLGEIKRLKSDNIQLKFSNLILIKVLDYRSTNG